MPFVPIPLGEYVHRFVAANPEVTALEVRDRVAVALAAFRQDVRCACGERIWVLGSAEVGAACFTCITGQADPSEDFELEEVVGARPGGSAPLGGSSHEA